ncbi:MAG: hypothetical protein DMD65_12630 [Gemmatimonadetes bacterium]|nr:MAG: hypothetical protein DMD65_12630 [Gemmatimonadota bacterium]
MRTLLCAALVVAACAPGDKASTATAGGPGQKFVGTFEGRSYRQVADTGIPWRSVMVIAPDGSLRGTLTFTSITAGPVPIRVRDITGSKLVQELGPYHSPTLKRDVVATSTAELKGDSLTGDYEVRPPEGGDVLLRGTFRAKRAS